MTGEFSPMDNTLLPQFEKIVNARYSCKKFDTRRKICPSILRRILLATLKAPSGFNLQPWCAIIVSMKSQRERLHEAALFQKQVLDAPTTVVFASSTKLSQTISEMGKMNGNADNFYFKRNTNFMLNEGPLGIFQKVKYAGTSLYKKCTESPMLSIPYELKGYGWKQSMIPVTYFMLAASSAGLQTACLEGIDEGLIKKTVGLPSEYSVPCIVSIGYEKDLRVSTTSRREPKNVFFDGIFGEESCVFD